MGENQGNEEPRASQKLSSAKSFFKWQYLLMFAYNDTYYSVVLLFLAISYKSPPFPLKPVMCTLLRDLLQGTDGFGVVVTQLVLSMDHLTRQFFISVCLLHTHSETGKNLPAMREPWVRSLGWEDPLEEGMATHCRIPAWRIPMDGGAWCTTVHQGVHQGVSKSRTRLSD